MIGYYVHHHGMGHMMRAQQVAAAMTEPVVLLSTRRPTGELPAHVSYVELPDDIVPDYEPNMKGAFHYMPWSEKIFARNQIMIDTFKDMQVTGLFVDTSAEVAALAELYGLKVGAMMLAGNRTDPVHQRYFEAADVVVSPGPQILDDASTRNFRNEVQFAGGICRFKKRSPRPIDDIQSVLILVSAAEGQLDVPAIEALAQANPTITWHIAGKATVQTSAPNITYHGVVPDLTELYEQADVVIGAGGNNTVFETAAFAKPFVCIPEVRPYDEQLANAKALERVGVALYRSALPTPAEWPTLVDEIRKLDMAAFSDIVDDQAAEHVARLIQTKLN